MGVITRGDLEVSLRMETFPARARKRIEDKVADLTERLEAAAQAAAPRRTGRLRTEIVPRVYSDNPNRVAGYVSVYAPDRPKEYAKAATLEYGADSPRRIPDHGGVFRKLHRNQKRIESRLTKSAHIEAFRYLRGPLEALRSEVAIELGEAITEADEEGT